MDARAKRARPVYLARSAKHFGRSRALALQIGADARVVRERRRRDLDDAPALAVGLDGRSCARQLAAFLAELVTRGRPHEGQIGLLVDRKSTRLNSSHITIS